jgi:hypothetical protein
MATAENAENIIRGWQSRLESDLPNTSSAMRDSIANWLTGDLDRWEAFDDEQVRMGCQSMEFRYSILRQRYLGVTPETAYQNLIRRLGSLVMLRNKIRTWVSLSRDRHQTIVDVIQEIVQELLNSDRYLQQQIAEISRHTTDSRLRNALLLTSLEEYCLRPIRNQPLLVYRFVNYLNRTQRGGLTQVPTQELVRIVSVEVGDSDNEESVNLLDAQTATQDEERQAWEERQALRMGVQREFSNYLTQQVDPIAAEWLKLYLRGDSQEAIATALNLPIKQIYRLREKVSYHAIRVFAFKHAPEIVANWLGTSVQEHRLGLNTSQWQNFWDSLPPMQQQILVALKTGRSLEETAWDLGLKPAQMMSEWSKIYLAAQSLRNQD